ncbi:MAG: hypothetical protein NUV46_00595 [Nanoarchaeota archaeon]|nr:hypothetical protein [Nanoarchaeota archaeon]
MSKGEWKNRGKKSYQRRLLSLKEQERQLQVVKREKRRSKNEKKQ